MGKLKVIEDNVLSREKLKQFIGTEMAIKEAKDRESNRIRDLRVQDIYIGKMRLKEREKSNFTAKLQETMERCEQCALKSVRETENYRRNMDLMELQEKDLINKL